jgi:hypothetical protein
MAGRVRPLVEVHRALTRLAGVVPGLLARQKLGEAVRPIAVCGQAAVELATVARLAVMAVEAHPRAAMLGTRASCPALLHAFPLVAIPDSKLDPKPDRMLS